MNFAGAAGKTLQHCFIQQSILHTSPTQRTGLDQDKLNQSSMMFLSSSLNKLLVCPSHAGTILSGEMILASARQSVLQAPAGPCPVKRKSCQ